MRSWFDHNLAALNHRCPEAYKLLSPLSPKPLEDEEGFYFSAPNSQVRAVLSLSAKGVAYLSLKEDKTLLRITSAYNPENEEKTLAERFLSLNPSGLTSGVTVLGLGLGYHLEELSEKLSPKSPIWLIEARIELAAAALAARDLTKIFKRSGFNFLIGKTKSLPKKAPKTILARTVNLRLDRELYPQIESKNNDRLETPKNASAALSAKTRVLFFDTGYFLTRELQSAATQLGYPMEVWQGRCGEVSDGEDYKRLFRQIKDFRPSIIVTINHLGFDAQGLLSDALERLGLAAASWFVDSPAVILNGAQKIGTKGLFAFSWDKSYLETLKNFGFEHVFYLPLATDETFFSPKAGPNLALRKIAFAGDSLKAASQKYLAMAGLDLQFLSQIDLEAEKFLLISDLTADNLAAPLAQKLNLNPEQEAALSALILWRASRSWRLKVLRALPAKDLTVAGDENWASLLDGAAICGQLDYYRELASFYRQSEVNLNITSAQMKSGLNQRVFDVPGAGGFLLTDKREQLTELFEPEKEVVCYDNPNEAAEKASWYLKRPLEREKIVQRARRRLLSEHLYCHRLKAMVELVTRAGP
ncbi:MAG: glycosyltransferase [Deltaproteobacteria bacterium]|nr:glycosyltransferase [Deltaproteobacteria bacterium]